MPSTFLGLNTSYRGLVASNSGLNTTANNISNIETAGYSRQKVNQVASSAIRTYTSYGCVGTGVDTLAAERVRMYSMISSTGTTIPSWGNTIRSSIMQQSLSLI